MKKLFLIFATITFLLSCNGKREAEMKEAHVLFNGPEMICDTQPVDTPIIKNHKKELNVWLETTSLGWFLEHRQTAWREAKAWGNKIIPIDSNLLLKCLCAKGQKIFLHIPNRHLQKEKNGNEYFRFYIVNNSTDSIPIPRIDAVINNISSSVSFSVAKDTVQQWLSYQQTDKTVECGNSFWTQKLPPKTAIEAQLESGFMNLGGEWANYRLELTLGNEKLTSNSIRIGFMKKQLPFLGSESF
jgi:hypothetical protein